MIQTTEMGMCVSETLNIPSTDNLILISSLNINIHILGSCAESFHEGYTTNIILEMFLRTQIKYTHLKRTVMFIS